jgi:hypothetical protein
MALPTLWSQHEYRAQPPLHNNWLFDATFPTLPDPSLIQGLTKM